MPTVDQPLKGRCEQCDQEYAAQDLYFNEIRQELLCFSCDEGQKVAENELGFRHYMD